MKTTQNLLIETPEGVVELEINHIVLCKNEDEMLVTLSAKIQDEVYTYQSETTEAALYLLAKDLPENWEIRSCLSCRYGHFCPVGNNDNELFCVTEFEPKSPPDLWHVTEDYIERKNRSRTLFDCCEKYKEQSKEYFTYNDYYFVIKDEK